MKSAHKTTRMSVLRRLLPLALMLVMIASLCAVGISAVSKDFETPTDLALAGKSAGIKVDGDISDTAWQNATWYGVARRQVATTMNNTIEFATSWDDKNFYVAFKVVDATVVTENLNENIFANDGIEIFIDPNNEKAAGKYDNKVAHLMYQVADGKFAIWGTADKWTDITSKYPSAKAAHTITDDGYTVEVSFSFAELGIDSAQDGTVFGLEVNNNDDDNAASNSDEDRYIQYWNEATDAANPATWGSVCLYNKAKTLISYPGTPNVDGKFEDSDGWIYSTEKINEAKQLSYRLASLCDDKNFYIAIDIWGADLDEAGMNFLFDYDNSKSAETPQHINDHSFKTNSGKYNQPKAIIKPTRTEEGYTVEMSIPLDILGDKPGYLDTVGLELQIFQAVADYNKSWTYWSDAHTGSVWSNTAGYGSLIFNNINVSGGNNTAPFGNQISSHSIAVGNKVSGKVTITDPDGDPLKFEFDSSSTQASKSYGTLELNESTGEWTYTPPAKGNMANKIANYYIKATDPDGASFRQRIEIRIEHAPTFKTYHVDGDTGKDTNDGLTPETALKTLYTVHSKLRPGDTVIIHESEVPYGYVEQKDLYITVSGLPDAYITFKAAEGERPVLNARNVWNNIKLSGSYIIIDGLTVKGQAHEIINEFDKAHASYHKNATGTSTGQIPEVTRYNTNGIALISPDNSQRLGATSVSQYKTIHHVEIRNCLVDGVAAGGIVGIGCDYIIIENNTIINTGWTDMYGSSGISLLNGADVDDNFDAYKFIIRNNICGGNRHFIPWVSVKKHSDGNGIIIDSTNNNGVNKSILNKGDTWGVQPFGGKTLVANNLVYLSGGSGIHVFDGDNCDLVNNTVFANAQTPSLGWSDFFSNRTVNVSMINNIVYSGDGNPMQISSASSVNCRYDYNLFFNYSSNNNLGKTIKGQNGKTGTIPGEHNIYGKDPMFVNAETVKYNKNTNYPAEWSSDCKQTARNGGYYMEQNYFVNDLGYDFSLKAGSPALGSGDKEWSDKIGNTDNRMGIFGTIGSPLMPVTVSDSNFKMDVDRGTASKTEPYTPPVEEPKDTTSTKDTTAPDKETTDESDESTTAPVTPDDGASAGFPTAIVIAIAAALLIGIIAAVVISKKKK